MVPGRCLLTGTAAGIPLPEHSESFQYWDLVSPNSSWLGQFSESSSAQKIAYTSSWQILRRGASWVRFMSG